MRGAERLGQSSMDMERRAGSSEAMGSSTHLTLSVIPRTILSCDTISMVCSGAGLLEALCGTPERFTPVFWDGMPGAQLRRATLRSSPDPHGSRTRQNLSGRYFGLNSLKLVLKMMASAGPLGESWVAKLPPPRLRFKGPRHLLR